MNSFIKCSAPWGKPKFSVTEPAASWGDKSQSLSQSLNEGVAGRRSGCPSGPEAARALLDHLVSEFGIAKWSWTPGPSGKYLGEPIPYQPE